MNLISAVLTPLDDEGRLHAEGLRRHLDDQWQAGIDGVLLGGTMGLLQLLADETWRALVSQGVEASRRKGEVLVGVGDCSFDRTRDRIRAVDSEPIDGIVVLAPYFIKFAQDELALYFESLANISRRPLYLYDLPARTGVKLEAPLVCRLARHPNIRGIKVSDDWSATRQLVHMLQESGAPESFRVIPAQPLLVDVLAREGADGNLDGVFALAPAWTRSIVDAVATGGDMLAAERQRRLARLLDALRGPWPLFPACTAILNARGIPGTVAPRPMQPLAADQRERLLALPVVRELLADAASASPLVSA
ncbi:MAG: dihydrodipicolinate synthase family protein [Planctomycetia bacterium]